MYQLNYGIPYSAKVKTPLKGWVFKLSDTIGTRVRCQNLAPQRGLKFGTPR
jgi:hypothetical protein